MDLLEQVQESVDQNRRFSHDSRDIGDEAEGLLKLPQCRFGLLRRGVDGVNLERRHDVSSIASAARNELRDNRRLSAEKRLSNYLGCNKFESIERCSPQ